MVKQYADKQPVSTANWLIGETCFMPEKKGKALRNMKNPGTAYENELLVSPRARCPSSEYRFFGR
jgi:Zn-dependent metalloprotease